MQEVSPELQKALFTGIPSGIIVPFLIAATVMISLRMTLVGDRRPVASAVNWYAFWMILYCWTREEWLVKAVIPDWLSMSDFRVVTSMAFIAAGTCIALVAVRWRSPLGTSPAWTTPAAAVWVLLCGAALWVISLPVRSPGGMALEELHNWRTGVFMLILLGGFIPPEAMVLFVIWPRSAVDRTPGRVAVASFLSAAIFVAIAGATMRIAVGFAWGAGVQIPHLPSSPPSADQSLYLSVIWHLPLGTPAVIAAIATLLGIDRATRSVTRLTPLWRDLTVALPTFLLPETGDLQSSAEREHRKRVEIEDTIYGLARYLPAGSTWPEDPEGRAALLWTTISTMRTHPVAPVDLDDETTPRWASHDSAVDAVAKIWISGDRSSTPDALV